MNKSLLVFITGLLMCLLATGMFFHLNAAKAEMEKTIFHMNLLLGYNDNLERQLLSCNESIEKFTSDMEFISVVDVTMYNAVPGQTDDTPLITASNKKINPDYATDHRWIAVSRDLHERWGGPLSFGDKVYVKGTIHYDGMYIVHDLMNERFTNRIDILRNNDGKLFKYDGIELFRYISSAPSFANTYRYTPPGPIYNSAR